MLRGPDATAISAALAALAPEPVVWAPDAATPATGVVPEEAPTTISLAAAPRSASSDPLRDMPGQRLVDAAGDLAEPNHCANDTATDDLGSVAVAHPPQQQGFLAHCPSHVAPL